MTAESRPAKEQGVVVTKEFCLALAGGIQAMREHASTLQDNPQFAADNGVGVALRYGVERQRQGADLLAGWFKRYAEWAGLNQEDFDV